MLCFICATTRILKPRHEYIERLLLLIIMHACFVQTIKPGFNSLGKQPPHIGGFEAARCEAAVFVACMQAFQRRETRRLFSQEGKSSEVKDEQQIDFEISCINSFEVLGLKFTP